MPPKKAPAKQERQAEHSSTVPANECQFSINMECKHEAGHYLKIKYDWLKVDYSGEEPDVTYPVTDTGHLKDWQLVQIEGEDPVAAEEQDPKAKAPPKKPDPKKGGSKLEEITDNRPRTVKYEFETSAEGQALEISEFIAKALTSAKLTLQVFDVNKDTLAESLLDQVEIDLSCMLFPREA